MSHTILLGDCIEQMRTLPDQSVNCCVTSPPYFGLRDYGHDDQIGLEETPDAYVQRLVEVFREVRRVLRDDGTLWLNLGDSYARNPAKGQHKPGQSGGKNAYVYDVGGGRASATALCDGLKGKDLIGIPWRVAFALQADGWYLRQDIIWHKPNPMPESVRDRCTKAHEYLFLLSKSPRYHYNHEAIKEPSTNRAQGNSSHKYTQEYEASSSETLRTKAGLLNYARKARASADNFRRQGSKREQAIPGQSKGTHREDRQDSAYDLSSRNKRSVWTVPTKPYKEAHFAVYPQPSSPPASSPAAHPGEPSLTPSQAQAPPAW